MTAIASRTFCPPLSIFNGASVAIRPPNPNSPKQARASGSSTLSPRAVREERKYWRAVVVGGTDESKIWDWRGERERPKSLEGKCLEEGEGRARVDA